jgi:hypothetical protein
MRFRHLFLAILVLAVCRSAPGTAGEARAAPAPAVAPDSIVEFLLASAATDFHDHRPPDPARFRAVRIGRMDVAGGPTRYLLCGEFLPAPGGGNADWVPFATIKTSGYEQWLGAQAVGYCQGSSIAWADSGDLSSSLQRRLDALR